MTGHLKTFNAGKKVHLSANYMRPSTDPHELYFHLAEVMTVHMILDRGMVSIYALAIHFHFFLHLYSLLRLGRPLNPMEVYKEDKVVLLHILHSHGLPQVNMQACLICKGISWNSSPISHITMRVSMLVLSLEAFTAPMRVRSGKTSTTSSSR